MSEHKNDFADHLLHMRTDALANYDTRKRIQQDLTMMQQ